MANLSTFSPTRRTLLKTVIAGAGMAGALGAGGARIEGTSVRDHLSSLSAFAAQTPSAESAASASRIRYTKIVDSETPIPDGEGNFVDFVAGQSSGPSISDGNVVFQGASAVGADLEGRQGIFAGVYTSVDGKLTSVADINTPIPEGPGTFVGFGNATISGDAVAFLGYGANGFQGVYTTLGGELKSVVDSNSREVGVMRELSFTLVTPTPITIPGRHGTFTGDRVVILGENAELQPWAQTRIEMLGTNTGPLQIVKMSTVPEASRTRANFCTGDKFGRTTCDYDGFPNIPLGGARLSIDRLPGLTYRQILRVENIGSSGADGVAQDVPESMEMETALLTPNFSLSQDGTSLVTTQVGIVGGKPDQLFSRMTITNEKGQLNVNGDWSPIGTTSYEIQVFNGSQLVTSQKGLRSGSCSVKGTPDVQAMRCHIWIIIITSFYYAFDTRSSASSPLLTFCVKDNSGQIREYSCDGLNNIKPLVNETSLVPDKKGRFTSFEIFSSLRNGTAAFTGHGTAGQLGIYTHAGGNATVIADTNTAIPKGKGNFTGFAGMTIDDDGSVAFTGYGMDDQTGIYRNEAGRIGIVADTNTPIPDGKGTFTSFGTYFGPSSGKGRLVFAGLGDSGQAGVYLFADGSLSTIVNNTMTLDGKDFSDYAIYLSPNGFDGAQVAFFVLFNDLSQAIYVANIDA
jgi:hypothetical protein